MSRVSPLLLLAAGAAALSACAPTTRSDGASGDQTAPQTQRQCFYTDQVRNFRVKTPSLYLHTDNNKVFQLEALGACTDLDSSAMGIAFLPATRLNRLCSGDWSDLSVAGGPSPQSPCRVRVVKQLTEAEVAALPERDRP